MRLKSPVSTAMLVVATWSPASQAAVLSGSYNLSAALSGVNASPPFFFGPFVNNPRPGRSTSSSARPASARAA